jgi:hypothetical protein
MKNEKEQEKGAQQGKGRESVYFIGVTEICTTGPNRRSSLLFCGYNSGYIASRTVCFFFYFETLFLQGF